jgi:hypothetical protein
LQVVKLPEAKKALHRHQRETKACAPRFNLRHVNHVATYFRLPKTGNM